MPNLVAYIALFSWPFIVVLLFRQLDIQKAIAYSLFGGYLILPTNVGVDLPILPEMDKTLIPSISALFMCYFYKKNIGENKKFAINQSWLPTNTYARVLLFTYLMSPLITGLLNSDPLYSGGAFLRGLTTYDSLSFALINSILALPFLIGRKYFSSSETHLLLIKVFIIAGLAYSVPIIIEVRLSPQLHTWVYGFFPHDSFGQQIRFGGFRPVVFLEHGLRVAIFIAMALLAAFALLRMAKGAFRHKMLLAVVWIALMLILCKTIGAIALAGTLAPVLFFGSSSLIRKAISVLILIILIYPILRGLDVIPTDFIVSASSNISDERAQSLQYRFDNEDILLDRANDRPFFGWGIWGRNHIYNEMGQRISTTDGRWARVMGTHGWIGYIAMFGILTLGTIYITNFVNLVPFQTLALASILTLNLLDLLTNSSVTPLTWLMAGAALGYAERLSLSRTQHPDAVRGDTPNLEVPIFK